MEFLSEKEWILFNEIAHAIHDIEDLDEMRSNLLELLTALIPNSSSSFYLANNHGGKLLFAPVANNIQRADIINYLNYGENIDYTMPIYRNAWPIAYKETDLFDNAVREKTEFYNEFLSHGLEYPMALCISRGGKCYGALSLFRSKRMGDFSNRDIFILNQLHNHLATRIYLADFGQGEPAGDSTGEIRQEELLTPRELEVLALVLQGLSNAEIGCRLFVEIGTVKRHIHNIYSKYNVRSRIQLLRVLKDQL